MKKKDYEATIVVSAPAKDAFRAIGRVSEWWTDGFEGRSQKINDVFTVRFGDTFATFKITELVTDQKIVWNVTDCNLHWINNKKEWKDTEIVFALSPKGDSTQIHFTHVGLHPDGECYSSCSTGWDHYIKRSLFSLITEGKGMLEKK